MDKYFYCLDVGGTFIKGGVVDESHNILFKNETPTKIVSEHKTLTDALMNIIKSIETESGFKFKNASGLGIGLPGLIDNQTGIIKFINCLNLKNYNIRKDFAKVTTVPIQIANDAELATLAEFKLGAGNGYNNMVALTLGTGIGSGIIINGTPLRKLLPFACETGHIKITQHPNESYEKLASTKALVEQTKQAMKNNPDSLMWSKYTIDTVSGKTVFDFKDTDQTAKMVFDNYISNLGTGIVNLYNIFSPEIIVIGGGVSRQGDALIKPLEEFVNKNIFTKNIGEKVKIIPAKFMNDAGILGARCLFDL